MQKSSEFVWRAARENIEDLPELPPDLNEPQYASLIFDSFCHVGPISLSCTWHDTDIDLALLKPSHNQYHVGSSHKALQKVPLCGVSTLLCSSRHIQVLVMLIQSQLR